MDDVITALTTALSPANLWGAVEPLAPLIAVLVVFGLGLTFVRRAVRGASRGKAKF